MAVMTLAAITTLLAASFADARIDMVITCIQQEFSLVGLRIDCVPLFIYSVPNSRSILLLVSQCQSLRFSLIVKVVCRWRD